MTNSNKMTGRGNGPGSVGQKPAIASPLRGGVFKPFDNLL